MGVVNVEKLNSQIDEFTASTYVLPTIATIHAHGLRQKIRKRATKYGLHASNPFAVTPGDRRQLTTDNSKLTYRQKLLSTNVFSSCRLRRN